MSNPKYGTADQRSRAREVRAQMARDAGIPDREPLTDSREPFVLPLAAVGFRDLDIEPRLGYVSWRAVDHLTGEVVHCAALKELLHWCADQVPRWLALRNFQ